MDEHRFDALARALGAGRSRRRALGLLAGAASLAGVGLAEVGEGAAAKHGKNTKHAKDGKQRSGHGDNAKQGGAGPSPEKKKKKCKNGLSRCKGQKGCFDLQTDPNNCGTCGTACATGQTCQAGTCGCGATSCATGCCAGTTCKAGTSTDACGSGGAACAACPAGASCTGGNCACPSGQTACAGACVDVSNDQSNCGQCGRACDIGQVCCSGSCASLTTVANCGACGHACQSGEGCCGGTCTGLNTVQNCGACGNVCPGYQQPDDNVTCQSGGVCTFTCQGDHYDVDGDPANGCETALTGVTYHTSDHAKAATPASQDCFDTSLGGFSGTIVSDARVHENPSVPGFDAATGAAPQWWKVGAAGGATCQDGLDATITMTGATTNCYKLTVITDKNMYSAQVLNGSARINPGSTGIYSDGSTIYFKVEKTCITNVSEVATYSVSYHL